jgi:hypothetical protein
MQRQMRSGGGMQEMMKAMMQGQGGDQTDMEEMQRALPYFSSSLILKVLLTNLYRNDVRNGRFGRPGWSRRCWRRYAEHG